MTDQLKKFLLPDHSTRVQAVRLTDSWQTGLSHQSLPECVQILLGELVAAATLLAANLKFNGSLVLQLQGDGPVALLVVECTAELNIRATATLREGQTIPADGTLQTLLNQHGEGRFTVVLDPNRDETKMQPYQGIVPLEGNSVARVLELYMRSSEQLDTRLWLAADATRCAGLLLQRLPEQGGSHPVPDGKRSPDETWEEMSHLFQTVEKPELLEASTDTLIHRLLWNEDLITFDPLNVNWHCPCTAQRVANMLRMLGQEEIMAILDEQGSVSVSCNFCGMPYEFDAVDCASLFVDGNTIVSSNKSVH